MSCILIDSVNGESRNKYNLSNSSWIGVFRCVSNINHVARCKETGNIKFLLKIFNTTFFIIYNKRVEKPTLACLFSKLKFYSIKLGLFCIAKGSKARMRTFALSQSKWCTHNFGIENILGWTSVKLNYLFSIMPNDSERRTFLLGAILKSIKYRLMAIRR